MGCCTGDREKFAAVRDEQKWEYINLDDFKSNSCWTPLAYGYLVIMLIISVSIYAVDTFTAINLIVFDRWSGQIKPVIPLSISRWIFAGCIILSFLLLIYRWVRAVRVMKKSGVAQSYLDPLAVRIQSIRMGKDGRGWKRFLVFAELTKSKKGADYVALFTYFSFEAWLRIVFAEGPRQVINALTLYSVMRLKLLPEGQNAASSGHSPIVQFFVNIGVLAHSNVLQAVILFGMLWTLIIWVISAISLLVSVILYLVFLFHHIPTRDGSLSKYCRRKINGRMERIVRVKVDKAMKKENQLRERQLAWQGGDVKRQPTLPNLGDNAMEPVPGISRQTTMTTLPEYPSRPHTGRSGDSIAPSPMASSDMHGLGRPPRINRSMTQASDASWASYNSNAPLMNGAGDMGYASSTRLETPTSTTPGPWNSVQPPNRNVTGTSQYSQRSCSPGPGSRPSTAQGGRKTPGTYQMEAIPRPSTGMSTGSGRSIRRNPSENESIPPLPLSRGGSANQVNPYFPPIPASTSSGPSWHQTSTHSTDEMHGRRTPASASRTYPPSLPQYDGSRSPVSPMRTPSPPSDHHEKFHTRQVSREDPQEPPQSFQPERSHTPQTFSNQRLYTPVTAPAANPFKATRPPMLPRLKTSGTFDYSQYIAYNPNRPNPSDSVTGGDRTEFRPMGTPPEPNGTGKGSILPLQSSRPPASRPDSFADILDNY